MDETKNIENCPASAVNDHGFGLCLENFQKNVLDSMEKTLIDYKSRHSQIDEEMKIRKAANDAILKQVKDQTAQISTLEASLKEYQDLNQANQNKVEQQKNELTKLNLDIAKLRMDNIKARDKMQDDVIKERKRADTMSAQYLQSNAAKFEHLKKQNEEFIAKISSLEAEKVQFDNAVEMIETLTENLIQNQKHWDEQEAVYKSQIDDLKSKYKSLKNDQQFAVCSTLQAHVEELTEENARLDEKVQSLENDLQTCKTLDKKESENEVSHEEILKLQLEIEWHKENHKNLFKKYNQASEKYDEAEKFRDKMSVRISELQQELKSIKSESSSNKTKVTKLTQANSVLKSENQKLKTEISQLKKSEMHEKLRAHQEEIQNLTAKLENHKRQSKETDDQNDALRKGNTFLSIQVSDMSAKLKDYKITGNIQGHSNNNFENERQQLNREIKNGLKKQAEQNKKLENLEKTLDNKVQLLKFLCFKNLFRNINRTAWHGNYGKHWKRNQTRIIARDDVYEKEDEEVNVVDLPSDTEPDTQQCNQTSYEDEDCLFLGIFPGDTVQKEVEDDAISINEIFGEEPNPDDMDVAPPPKKKHKFSIRRKSTVPESPKLIVPKYFAVDPTQTKNGIPIPLEEEEDEPEPPVIDFCGEL